MVRTGRGGDSIRATALPDGPDVYELGDGGDQADYVNEIASEGDIFDYGARSRRIVFRADDRANDGSAGEGDLILGAEAVEGGAGDDLMVGNGRLSAMFGGAGDDRLLGHGGTDALSGDKGKDFLDGGDQYDELLGGRDDDGGDLALGGSGPDSISLDAGADRALGGAGDDSIVLGAGPDRGYGGEGKDTLAGQSGADLLRGGDDDDRISGGLGPDRLDGEGGRDSLTAGVGGGTAFELPARFVSGPLDSWRDLVDCGEGRDATLANPWDDVESCERVFRINAVELERPRLRRKTGSFVLPLFVWSDGRLRLFGPDVETVVRELEEATDVVVPIEPKGTVLRSLRRHGSATLTVRFRFVPEVGFPRTVRRELKLFGRPRG